MNTQVMRHIQLYKHPLIMIYASVDLSGIITSILSPPLPFPRPERVPPPPAAQPFNLVSPICMTGTKTYDLAWPHTDVVAGRSESGLFSQFLESLISPCGLHYPAWITLGRELLNIINTLICHPCLHRQPRY